MYRRKHKHLPFLISTPPLPHIRIRETLVVVGGHNSSSTMFFVVDNLKIINGRVWNVIVKMHLKIDPVWYELMFLFKSVLSGFLFYGGFRNKPLIPSFIFLLLLCSNHKSLLFTSFSSQHPIFLCHPILCRFLPLFLFFLPHPSISQGVKWLRRLDALQLHVQTIRGSAVYLHF